MKDMRKTSYCIVLLLLFFQISVFAQAKLDSLLYSGMQTVLDSIYEGSFRSPAYKEELFYVKNISSYPNGRIKFLLSSDKFGGKVRSYSFSHWYDIDGIPLLIVGRRTTRSLVLNYFNKKKLRKMDKRRLRRIFNKVYYKNRPIIPSFESIAEIEYNPNNGKSAIVVRPRMNCD